LAAQVAARAFKPMIGRLRTAFVSAGASVPKWDVQPKLEPLTLHLLALGVARLLASEAKASAGLKAPN
jgi:hypothetical protein